PRGASDGATPRHFHRFDARRLERGRALGAHTVRNAAHAGRPVVGVGLFDFEYHPFKHLGSLAIALDHPYVDADRVARSNSGQVAAPLQLQQISKFRHNSAGTCGEYTRRLSGFSATPGAPGAHEPGWRGAKLA